MPGVFSANDDNPKFRMAPQKLLEKLCEVQQTLETIETAEKKEETPLADSLPKDGVISLGGLSENGRSNQLDRTPMPPGDEICDVGRWAVDC